MRLSSAGGFRQGRARLVCCGWRGWLAANLVCVYVCEVGGLLSWVVSQQMSCRKTFMGCLLGEMAAAFYVLYWDFVRIAG